MVAAVVLVDTMFYAAIAPLLPYYAHHFDLAKAQAGMLAATYAAGTLLGAIPAGWLAARVGVRATIVTGLGLMVGSSVVFALGRNIAVLDAARFVQGVGGSASWAAGLAWLIERAPASRRAEMIGAALAAAIAGALLGPVLGTAATQTSPKLVFLLVAGLGLLLLLWTLTEPAPAPSGAAGLRVFAPALRDGRVVTGMWLTTLGALLYGTLAVLAPLRLNQLGAGSVTVGAAFLLGAAAAGLASPFVGRLVGPARLARAGAHRPVRVDGLGRAPCPAAERSPAIRARSGGRPIVRSLLPAGRRNDLRRRGRGRPRSGLCVRALQPCVGRRPSYRRCWQRRTRAGDIGFRPVLVARGAVPRHGPGGAPTRSACTRRFAAGLTKAPGS